MKKQVFLSAIFLFFSAALFLQCKNDQAVKETTTIEKPSESGAKKTVVTEYVPLPSLEGAQEYKITEGTISWMGKKATGGTHTGTIKANEGILYVKENRFIGCKATIDMNSIANEDIKEAGERADLEKHLKDNDFFEVKKFPKGEFVITDILPNNTQEVYNLALIGNLTLKGITKEVKIPAKVAITGDNIEAETPTFVINRTDWGIKFQSGLFGTAKDKAIDDYIALSIKLKAKK